MPPEPQGLVDNLVTQFSDALDCFRELVQNAIDAGSLSVHVWGELQLGDGQDDSGAIVFAVEDTGEGMDEAIIDGQLTKLFASNKEDDLTKIGKFGIGFVSVFALDPRAVIVHTGRGGEFWEIFFHPDRSFSKSRLDEPTEGTTVTLVLEGGVQRYRELVAGVRASLTKWCAHSETEITLEDRSPPGDAAPTFETINQPFAVDGLAPVVVSHPGTDIAVVFHDHPSYGFYNRGLTLAFTTAAEQVFEPARARALRRVAVKIKSRYLEHTLSRDTVLRDANYHKAMALLDDAVAGPLVDRLGDRLERLAALGAWSLAEQRAYAQLCSFAADLPDKGLDRLTARPVFRLVHGGVATAEALRRRLGDDGHVLVDEGPSPFTERLHALGIPVVVGSAGWGRGALELRFVARFLAVAISRRHRAGFVGALRRLWTTLSDAEVAAALRAPEQVYHPVEIDEAPPPALTALISAAAALHRRAKTGYARFLTGVAVGGSADPPLFFVGPEPAALMAAPSRALEPRDAVAVVNRSHPHLRRLAALHRARPRLAAYCLAKALLLAVGDAKLHLDQELTLAAAQTGGA